MKKIFCIFAAAVLTLCAAFAAAEGVVFKTDYFTLELPEGWVTDYEDLEKEDNLTELGFFGEDADKGLVAAAYLVYYEDLKDVALWSSDSDEMQAYIEAVLEDFRDDHPEYLGTVMAGKIPLVLIKATDGDDEYLYADTMTNGYAIQIEAFVTDNSDEEKTYPLTEETIETFKKILSTFQPVT